MKGAMVPMVHLSTGKDTQLPQYRRHPRQLHLIHAEQENPNEVSGADDPLSKSTAKKAEFLSGRRKDQKANAADRKGTGKDNWADRANDGGTHAEKRLT
jgi:hypothetical protein